MAGESIMLGRRITAVLLPLAGIVAVLCLAAVAEACPTCKDNLSNDANASGLVTGFFWSILFMLSVPALLALSWVVYLVYHLGKAEEEAERNAARAAQSARNAMAESRLPVDVA